MRTPTSGSLSIYGINVVDASTAVQRLMPRGPNLTATEVPIVDPGAPGYRVDAGPFNWRGLLAQSLFFNVVENTFRAASDDQIRLRLAKKPFLARLFCLDEAIQHAPLE